MKREIHFIGIDESCAAARISESHPAKYLVGIDEAGMGPLAGPVVVAAVGCRRRSAARLFTDIRDSKRLTPRQRDAWYERITAHPAIEWAVTNVSARVIDRMNIRRAALVGARRLARRFPRADARFLLDGGLVLPTHYPQETIVKGDEREPVIAAASIIAKVTRDRIMVRLHKKYPLYGFDRHKGYGTLMHRALVAEFGRSPVHRETFRAGLTQCQYNLSV